MKKEILESMKDDETNSISTQIFNEKLCSEMKLAFEMKYLITQNPFHI